MATYVVTSDPSRRWDPVHAYKYRYRNRAGAPFAQEEVERRRAQGRRVHLWRWERNRAVQVLLG
jgi:hypothetical protein